MYMCVFVCLWGGGVLWNEWVWMNNGVVGWVGDVRVEIGNGE